MTIYTVHIEAVTVERPCTTEYNRVYGAYTSYEKAEVAILNLVAGRDVTTIYDTFEWIHNEDEERYFITAKIQEVEVQ